MGMKPRKLFDPESYQRWKLSLYNMILNKNPIPSETLC